MLKIGSVFADRYRILCELGSGGMSIVYLAMDDRMNRQYAVKIVRKEMNIDTDIVRNSLVSEASLLKQLYHPSIPNIHEIREESEYIYIIMDYIEGSSLESVIHECGPQSVENVLSWAQQLAEVLSYLHKQGIIFRDMKPANVMLQPNGQLKLLDFGIAQQISRRISTDPYDTVALGTLGFAAPEIYVGQYDVRSDIYALGMTLHYLLTGITPGRGEYFPAKHWRPEIPDALDAIINKCVQVNPEHRYQTCQDLLYDLSGSCESAKPSRKIFSFLNWFRKGQSDSYGKLFQNKKSAQNPPVDPDPSHTAIMPFITGNDLTSIVHALLTTKADSKLSEIRIHTEYQNISATNRIIWGKIQHLNIIGPTNRDAIGSLRAAGLRSGAYLNYDSTWLLLIEPTAVVIQECISSCGSSLEVLQIGHSTIETLYLDSVHHLQELYLSRNRSLHKINGLSAMHDLRILDVSHTSVGGSFHLEGLSRLQKFHLNATKISNIVVAEPLLDMNDLIAESSELTSVEFLLNTPYLQVLNLASCPIPSISAALLLTIPELKTLDISFTKITELPGLDALRSLEYLDCGDTNILFSEDTKFPQNLSFLRLSRTPLRKIPDDIQHLTRLHELHISGLYLDELPDWLPDIASHFDVGQSATIIIRWDRCTVTMIDTTVTGVDMEIFSRPYAMVLQWFREQKEAKMSAENEQQEGPLNETKIVFLGDGEVGKSLTVARLLQDGGFPENFDSNATPGIAIAHRTYSLDDRNILVHFWDFGGQEIMHSMHRMFLTQRTLYVVLINAREDKPDDRARYWLHSIKSFADGSPVLLAINKIDQNPNASINETGLRENYPALTEIVRMSALTFSQAEFNAAFTKALLRQISNFNMSKSSFLPAWYKVKKHLSSMPSYYIDGSKFNELCESYGVINDEKSRKELLKWFNDLGVSFCYSDSARLEDYVILKPDWITNAIYTLLFNSIPGQKNGMVSHEQIHRMLNPPAHLRDRIRRVLPDVTYSVSDTEYVLNVIRRFRLSYLVNDNAEFFPMLCQKDAKPIAARYAADSSTLEFQMVYDYLPNNVIHRLMVDMHRDLDMENVWLTGARFFQHTTTLSAVVKSDGNILTLYVRSGSLRHPANVYLDMLVEVLDRINQDMGLQVRKQVVYKADGISEAFDYDYLLGSYNHGVPGVYCKQGKKMVPIEEILFQTDHHLDKDREQLIDDLIAICLQLQANKLYWDVSENDRNTYIRDLLRGMKYIAMDQSFSGISSGHKLPGELDLDIRKDPNIPWTIFEGLNIYGTSPTQMENWDNHLKKLLDNYNANGLPFLILTSYVLCSKARFEDTCNAYATHIRNYSPGIYTVQSMTNAISSHRTYGPNQFLQIRKCVYDCGGHMTNVYHIFVHIGA